MDHGSAIKQLLCKTRRKFESKGNIVNRSYVEIGKGQVSLLVDYTDKNGHKQEYLTTRSIRTSVSDTVEYILNTI